MSQKVLKELYKYYIYLQTMNLATYIKLPDKRQFHQQELRRRADVPPIHTNVCYSAFLINCCIFQNR